MTCTIEMSFYPLNNDYALSVVGFLQKLRNIPDIEVKTNGMSTVMIAPYDKLWPAVGVLIQEELGNNDCVFVLKVAPGRREYVD